jgi:SAM-dependent MidA family methyltransferase
VDDLAPPQGPTLLFASELYDARPVYRVIGTGDELAPISELFVEVGQDGGLQWRPEAPDDPTLQNYLYARDIHLEKGQIAELRPNLPDIHQHHLSWCGENAIAVMVDYGYPSAQLYNARGRRNGTLIGYRRHAVEHDVLQDPGEIDITAHVNFSDLIDAATMSRWTSAPIRPLGLFLATLGAIDQLPKAAAAGLALTNRDWQELQSAKTLLLPMGMGADLKVLVQGRGRAWKMYQQLCESHLQQAGVES